MPNVRGTSTIRRRVHGAPCAPRPGARSTLLIAVAAFLLLLGACGGPAGPLPLTVFPEQGPPGTVVRVEGLAFDELDLEGGPGLEVWIGDRRAPARRADDGSLAAAIPLYLGADGWPDVPREPQMVEVRRVGTVLGRSLVGVTVTELPPAPGTTRLTQQALSRIGAAYASLIVGTVPADGEQGAVRDGALAMLQGLIDDGDHSLAALLDGSSVWPAASDADLALVDAVLASTGSLAYLTAYGAALSTAAATEAAVGSQALSLYCRGAGEAFELACQMQIHAVLDDYSRAFVKPTAETYANTVGLASGLLAIEGVTVPAAAIVGAILSVVDFVMEKVAPALFPSKLSGFELSMPRTTIEVGETTDSRLLVTAVNAPPQITYLDVFEQVKTLVGLKNVEFEDAFYDALKATAEFTLELYLKIIKGYASAHPGSFDWVGAGDIRMPAMSWGPVEVTDADLVKLFSFDEDVVESLEEQLEWRGAKLGDAEVRMMPRGPGERSKVLRDHALCLGCVYAGGAFGDAMPESHVTVIVGSVELHATPASGLAPLDVTFEWTGLQPQEEPLSCRLDPGDGSAPYTIADCAVTTSQAHRYPFTSVLDSATHRYGATLEVVGTSKVASTEVMPDWTFTAAPGQGEAPLATTFTWQVPVPPAAGPVSCRLDPGDGSAPYAFDDCLAVTTATHEYEDRGSFVAALTILNAVTQDTKTAPVSVSEVGECANLLDVGAWRGSIQYAHSRDVSDDSHRYVYQRDVNVRGDLARTYLTATNAGFALYGLGGNVALSSESHDLGPDHDRIYRTFEGSGVPDADSRILFNVSIDCGYSFYTIGGVAGHGTFYDEPFDGVDGYNPLNGEFDGTNGLSGSYAFPVYDPSDIEASVDKPIWFAEDYDVADLLAGADLGVVTVTWSFTPIVAP